MEKLALVTGANRGIGKEVCRQLAKEGYEVILTARDPEKGKTAARDLQQEQKDITIHFHQLDVTDPASIAALKDFVADKFGRLDLLVNNAGIVGSSTGTTSVDLEIIRKTFEINFYGPFQLSRQLLPFLKKSSDGRIINVSSRMGQLNDANSGFAGYRISKTALNALSAVMAADLLKAKIKVVAVCPGRTQTDMGGKGAPRSLKEGASGLTWLAISPDVISGKFYRDGKTIDW